LRVLVHDYGGYAFTAQLGRALAAKGHQVYYSYSLTTQLMQRFTPPTGMENLTVEGVTLHRPFARYNYMRRWRDERTHGRLVAARVRDFRPEVVLSANTPLDAQALIQQGSREVGAKFIFWMQDLIGLATRSALRTRFPFLGDLIGAHYLRLEKRLLKASERVVVISKNFLAPLRAWGIEVERIHHLPNWAALEEIPLLPKDNAWARAQGLADQFVFLFSGVLGLKHDATPFLALAQSFAKDPGVRVVVVAEGPFAEQLRSLAAAHHLDNLVILPYQPAAVYPMMLAAADVLMTVLSPAASTYSVPSRVYSYMCAARPLLLSIPQDNPIVNLVKEHRMGLVVEPRDQAGWLDSAHALYQNRYNNHQMGVNARAYAEEHFEITRIGEAFEDILHHTLKGS